MSRDPRNDPTRRRFLETGVGLAGLFAGCTGGNDAGSGGNETSGTDAGAIAATPATAAAESTTSAIYPDAFGNEQLFDRKRVANIVTEGR